MTEPGSFSSSRIADSLLALLLGVLFVLAFFGLPCLSPEIGDAAFLKYRSAVDRAGETLNRTIYERPVLRGEAVERNGWVFYLQAAEQLLKPVRPNLGAARDEDFSEGSPLFEYVEANEAAVEQVRKGTQCTAVGAVIDYRAGGMLSPHNLCLVAPGLGGLMMFRSRMAERKGDMVKAADLLLDMIRFGQDLSRGGVFLHSLTGDTLGLDALRALAALLRRQDLAPDHLRRVALELHALEETHHPLVQTASNQQIQIMGEVLNILDGRPSVLDAGEGEARTLSRAELHETLERTGALFKDFFDIRNLEFPSAYALADHLDGLLNHWSDPVLDACLLKFASHLEIRAAFQGLLRAMAFAAEQLAQGPVRSDHAHPQPPMDPFTGTAMGLDTSKDRRSFALRSTGRDFSLEGNPEDGEWDLNGDDLVLRVVLR